MVFILAAETATGIDWLGIITLCGVILLSGAGMIALFFWMKREQVESNMRETLLFRLTQIEGRLRVVEESHRLFDHELQVLGERISRKREERITTEANDLGESEAAANLPGYLSGSARERNQHVQPAPELSPQVAEILNRYQQGQEILHIAREMGLGQGEVQLVISLMARSRG